MGPLDILFRLGRLFRLACCGRNVLPSARAAALVAAAISRKPRRIAVEQGIDPALMHRVAAIGSGAIDSLPHDGAVVTLLAVCGSTHRESHLDIVMVGIVGALVAVVAVIALGSTFGSF